MNFHGIAGLLAGLEYIAERGLDSIHQRKRELNQRIAAGLQAIKGLRVFGPDDGDARLPVFSVAYADSDPSDLANKLNHDHDLITRVGLHCAPWAHKTIGSFPVGTVRISPGLFHTDEDIDYLLDCLARTTETMK